MKKNKKNSPNKTNQNFESTDYRNAYSRLIQNVYSNSSNIFFSHTIDGIITFISPQVEKILGYKKEEVKFNYKDLLTDHPINLTTDSILDSMVNKHVTPDPFEIEVYTKDGSKKWLLIRETPIVENGVVVSIDGAAIDITERKRIEIELNENQSKFYQLFSSSPNLIAISEIDTGEFIDINDNGAKILGYNKDFIIGKTSTELGLIHPEFRQEIVKELKEKGVFNGRELFFLRGTGEKAVGLFHSQIISLSGQECFFHTMIDITERKSAETKLIESESNYRLLVENQKDYILKFDTTGKILFASPNYLKSFGIVESEIIGKPFLPDIHPDDFKKIKSVLDRALKPPYIVQHEERMKTVEGWRWISWVNKPIINIDGTINEIISVGRDINKRKSAEIELAKSEERFKNVINSLPDLVIIGDYNDNTLFINNSMKKLTGLTKDDLNKGKDKFQFVHDQDRERVLKFKDEFLSSNKTVSEQIDNRFINSKEEVRWHSSIITKISFADIPALLYLIRDITERKESEEEIRKLALIAKETINGVSITSATGLIEWVNDGFEKITGYKLDEVKGIKPGQILQGEETSEKTVEEIRRALKNQEHIKTEILNYKKDGFSFWNELIIQPVFDDEKKLVNYIGLMSDVTERKESEKAILFSEEKFSKAFHSSPNAILITRLEDGNIIDVNEGFTSIFEHSRDESIGKSSLELNLWKYKRDREFIVDRLSEGNSVKKIEVEFSRKSGASGVAELSMDTIYLNNEKCILSVVFDITDKKKSEKILQENQAKLRSLTAHLQNVRENERKNIARGIHDELGQILTALKMNIRLLQHEFNNRNIVVEKEHIITELDSLSEMVDESVKSAKRIIKDLRPELLDKLGLIAALDQHITDYCNLAGLEFDFDYNMSDFELDNDLAISIFRTVQEALNNTVKYAKATKVNVCLDITKNKIHLTIEDNGIGFKPDFLTKRNSFGLFGMRERILNFGGNFSLETNINEGTTIDIDIPLKL